MNVHPATSDSTHDRRRRGFALVSVLVLLVISVTLFGLWARTAVREHQQMASRELRLQADRLAAAGLRRALARRAADPAYRTETWSVPADALGGRHAAEVQLRVGPADDAAALRYEATAVLPVGAPRRVQITKRMEIPNPPSGDES